MPREAATGHGRGAHPRLGQAKRLRGASPLHVVGSEPGHRRLQGSYSTPETVPAGRRKTRPVHSYRDRRRKTEGGNCAAAAISHTLRESIAQGSSSWFGVLSVW